MKAFLGLAAEFFDQLSNPVHGIEASEAAGARLAMLQDRDKELSAQLAAISLAAEDVDLLSTTGWLWYLAWRREQGNSTRPEDAFLDALFNHTHDPVVRLRVLEEIVRSSPASRRFAELRESRQVPPLRELPDSWLRARLLAIVSAAQSPEPRDTDRTDIALHEAIEFATYLLQIGHPVAWISLGALLRFSWVHSARLHEFMRVMLEQRSDDNELLSRRFQLFGLEG